MTRENHGFIDTKPRKASATAANVQISNAPTAAMMSRRPVSDTPQRNGGTLTAHGMNVRTWPR